MATDTTEKGREDLIVSVRNVDFNILAKSGLLGRLRKRSAAEGCCKTMPATNSRNMASTG